MKSTSEKPAVKSLLQVLGSEGFRLFFSLSALYAACWPLLWIIALGFDLPLATEMPPSLWHAHEMIIGAFGAALIGFLTTAAPEWTDTKPLRGTALFVLAGIWGLGRGVGVLGWDGAGLVGAFADCCWLILLIVYLLHLSWQRRSDRLLAFVFWLCVLVTLEATARWYFATGNIETATKFVYLSGFAFLGLLGLALARITVPVTNLVLDPSEKISPFRPHPGRLNLASGLVLVAITGEIAGLNQHVLGFLFIAAGAGFMDRIAENFIGRASFRTEILLIGTSAVMAGTGMFLIGAAKLGAPFSQIPGLHLALMGGLGTGIFAVFCIAGLLHSGRRLGLSRLTRVGAIFLISSIVIRVAPELFELPFLSAVPYTLVSVLWATAFGLWLFDFWPALSRLDELPGDKNHI